MKRYRRKLTFDDVISKRTGTEIPFKYNLYVWFAHLAVVVLDPILYPFGYECNLVLDACCRRLRWGIDRQKAKRAAALARKGDA